MTIIMYHYVRNLKHSRYPEIKGLDVDLFREQLKYILNYYKVIKMQELLEALKEKKTLPRNSLLLTFDDGYKDHFEFVFPILDELGIQGSFFPSAKAIKEQCVLDVNKIQFILASIQNGKLLIEVIYSFLDQYRSEYGLESNEYFYNKLAQKGRFDTEEVVFIKQLLQKCLPEKLRKMIINELFFTYVNSSEALFSGELYMNVDQLKCMFRHGMYIGSHGWDHYWLGTLPEYQQENEIKLSLEFLAEIGSDTYEWAMCYPHGSYNDSLMNLLSIYGCKLALTTEVGIANLNTVHPLVLPRLDTNALPKDENAEPNRWTLEIINS